MFIVNLKYIVSSAEVDKIRAEHIKFLDRFYAQNQFLASGKKYDGSGGVIIVLLEQEDQVHSIMKQDPFVIEKIAEYNVIGFDVTKKSFNL